MPMSIVRGAALERALARLESRFGTGVAQFGARAAERRARSIVPSRVGSLDALLGGGLVAGEPRLLVGGPTSGALTLALRAVASAQDAGGEVAWIDAARCFDPLAAERAGVDLERVFLFRGAGDAAVHAAVTVARSSAFVLLVVDLGPRFTATLSVDALAPVLAQVRARGGMPLLVVSEDRGRRLALPSLELRQGDWLRSAGRLVGWRATVTRAYGDEAASFAFAPLALPQVDVADEGLRASERRAELAG